MAEEIVTLLRIDTGESVRNIADIRENVRLLKEALKDENNTWEQQQAILEKLQVNQAALKNAMYGTKASLDDVSKAATGFGIAFDAQNKLINDGTISYNALVKKMAELDQEFRATGDAVRRAELGHQIKSINDQLKEFDADRGKYARNVGNYRSAIEGLGTAFKSTAGSAGALINPISNVTSGLATLSKTPVIGMLGLLASALAKVVTTMQNTESSTWAWNRALAAFKPIGDAFTRSLQTIGDHVADLAGKFVDLLYKWGLLDEEAGKSRQALTDMERAAAERRRVMLVENARLEADVAAAREKVQEKERYTLAERIGFLKEAQWAEEQIAKNNLKMAQDRLAILQKEASFTGNSIAVNDALAQAEADVERQRAQAAQNQRRIQRELNTLERERQAGIKDTTGAVREELETIEAIPATLTAAAEQMDATESYMDRALLAHIEKRNEARKKEMEDEKQRAEARKTLAFEYAATLSSVLGSIADMMEADGEQNKRSAQKVKALRTASAIIETISGAIAAYMNGVKAIEFPPGAGIALGIAQAATVLAAGMSNVRKIQATKIGDGDSGSGASVPAMAMAPAAGPSIPATRTITGVSEVDRLNRMADDKRVVLVWSDVELKQHQQRVQIQETDF